jgi:hypothetical protein
MRFCDRAAVQKVFEDRSVAIVGSGPGSLENPKGLIDSHDVVVRVNNYKLFPSTGFRTDVHYSFYGKSIRKTARELKRDGVKLCMCKCPNAKVMDSEWHERRGKLNGVDFRYIYEDVRKNWWFTDTYVPSIEEFMEHFNLLGGHVATTGFAALLDVLSHKPSRVYMTGFDFFSSGIHNVNERWRKLNPDDPIGHRPDAEQEWFRQNYDAYPITMDARLSAMVA